MLEGGEIVKYSAKCYGTLKLKKKKTSNSIQLIAFYSGYFTGREDWADGDTVRQPVFPRSGT